MLASTLKDKIFLRVTGTTSHLDNKDKSWLIFKESSCNRIWNDLRNVSSVLETIVSIKGKLNDYYNGEG